jgi:hypothetical protein
VVRPPAGLDGRGARPLDPGHLGLRLAGTTTFGLATEDAELLRAAPQALRRLDQPRYLDWDGADAYADSIEGALLLLNRFPEAEGVRGLEKVLPLFLGKPGDDGVVEGWYGDGDYALTALMAALYYTPGACCRPWRPDVGLGTVPDGPGARVRLTAEKGWKGRLHFDRPRHRLHFRLPRNYPRLNEFPERFTVEPAAEYRARLGAGREVVPPGAGLAGGWPWRCRPEERWPSRCGRKVRPGRPSPDPAAASSLPSRPTRINGPHPVRGGVSACPSHPLFREPSGKVLDLGLRRVTIPLYCPKRVRGTFPRRVHNTGIVSLAPELPLLASRCSPEPDFPNPL